MHKFTRSTLISGLISFGLETDKQINKLQKNTAVAVIQNFLETYDFYSC